MAISMAWREWMASLERELREEVARLDAGAALPDELGKTLFAWKNATYMARRRSASEPPGELTLEWELAIRPFPLRRCSERRRPYGKIPGTSQASTTEHVVLWPF